MASQDGLREAIGLIRGASVATLACSADGQPFASLVTPACAPDLSPLMLLSSLSAHTRMLAAEPRCSLLFTGTAPGRNPQTAPRVTVTGLAAPVPESEVAALKARWLVRHPYAADYAGFADFALWRVRIGGALHVGGFAQAGRLKATELAPEPARVTAILAAESAVMAHVNADHADAVAAIAQGLLAAGPGEWRLAAVDVDGCDLSDGSQTVRLAFLTQVSDAEGVRAALIRAAREGRARLRG